MIVTLSQTMQGLLGRPLGDGDLERFTRALADQARARPGAVEAARAAFATAAARYLAVFERYDVVLTPTLAVVPWHLGWLSPTLGRAELLTRTEQAVGYTPIHNIAGVPSMSVPLHFSCDGLPIGTCFAARRGGEATLFALAYELEAARPWCDRWPPFSDPLLFKEG
jgi:amidase